MNTHSKTRQVLATAVAAVAVIATAWILGSYMSSDGGSRQADRPVAPTGAEHPSAAKSAAETVTEEGAQSTAAAGIEAGHSGAEPSRSEFANRHRVRVHCCGPTKKVIASATIQFVPDREYDWSQLDTFDPRRFDETMCSAKAVTDVAGDARVDLVAGRWLAVVRAAGRHASARWFDVPATRRIDFVLEDVTVVDGRVVDGVSKAPIQGASILAFVATKTDESGDPSSRVARMAAGQRTLTNADGDFRLDDVPNDRLELDVSASGFPTRQVFLCPSKERFVVELNGIAAANGVVVDQNGAPIEDVQVEVWLRGRIPSTKISTTRTDEVGEFHLRGLLDGDVAIVARKRGYGFAKKNVVLDSGKTPWFEFELGPEAPLKGVVVDELRQPVAGATVRVRDRDFDDHEVGQMVTERDGSWYMLWLVPGHRIDVTIEADGFRDEEFKNVPLKGELQTFTLRRLASLHGRVVDPDGKPVTKFALWTDARLRTLDDERTRALSESTWTEVENERGEFDFDTLEPCDYELRFVAEGMVDEVVSYPASRSRAAQQKALEVRMQRGGVVAGRVVDETSKPLIGVTVGIAGVTTGGRDLAPRAASCVTTAGDGGFTLRGAPRGSFDLVLASAERGRTIVADLCADDFPRDLVMAQPGAIAGHVSSPWRDPTSCLAIRITRLGSWVGRNAAVDAHGRFESGPLAPGQYEVDVADAWACSEMDGDFDYSRVVSVAAGTTAELEIAADPKASIRGSVRDHGGQIDPLAVTILVAPADHDSGFVATARLQSDFRYLVPGLAPGRYAVTLDLSRPGELGHLTREVDVGATSSPAQLDFDVGAPAFTGRVVDGSDAPIAASVTLVGARDGARLGEVRCDRDGRYRIVPPAPVECIVWVTAGGFAEDDSTSIDLAAPPNATTAGASENATQSTELKHVLEVESRVEITVLDDDRRPISEVSVRLDVSGRSPLLPAHSASTDASGVVRFTGLRSGGATVTVGDRRYAAAAPIPTQLDRASTRRVVVVLDRLASLTVFVHDEHDVALADVDVQCAVEPRAGDTSGPKNQCTARTDSRGVARFDGLAPGRATVTVGDVTSEPVLLQPAQSGQVDVEAPRTR